MRPQGWRYNWQRARHALRRRRLAPAIDRLYREIIGTWDQPQFAARFRRYWDPFEELQAAKFLNVEVWLREAIFRYLLLEVPRDAAPLEVIDLGSGTGYFLLVCRHLGHGVRGLDVDTEPLYNECHEFFQLPRITHRIQPTQPLPDLPCAIDLATAFMTCFNQHDDQRPWDEAPWRYFLEDLRGRLSDRGRLAIKFNRNPLTGEFYSAAVRRAISGCGHFRARFFLDYVFLDAA